jgi:succinate dehydrogenase hydrophobic anchor subunit
MLSAIQPILATAPATQGLAAGAALLFFCLFVFLSLVFSALFIHVAAGIMGIARGYTFGTAIKAVLWQILYVIVLSVLLVIVATVLPPIAVAAPLLPWFAATFGIQQAYAAPFFTSLVTAVISVLLVYALLFLCAFAIAFGFGLSLTQMLQDMQRRQPVQLHAPEIRELNAAPVGPHYGVPCYGVPSSGLVLRSQMS